MQSLGLNIDWAMIHRWIGGELVLFKMDLSKIPWCGYRKWKYQDGDSDSTIDHTVNTSIEYDEKLGYAVTKILFSSGISCVYHSSDTKSLKNVIASKIDVNFPQCGITIHNSSGKNSSHVEKYTINSNGLTLKYSTPKYSTPKRTIPYHHTSPSTSKIAISENGLEFRTRLRQSFCQYEKPKFPLKTMPFKI